MELTIMSKYKELLLYDVKSVKRYFKNNKVLAYGNGSFYLKIKLHLEQFNIHFEDVLYTNNSKIESISGKNYEDTIKNYSILICSSFYNEIINILENKGIKSISIPSFKNNNIIHYKEYISITMAEKHKKLIKNIQHKKRIRIIFLAIHKSIWKVEQIYKEMLNDSYFEPIILVCPYTYYNTEDEILKELNETTKYFKDKNYKVLSSYIEKEDRWLILEELNPDIVFFTYPHHLTKKEYYEDAFINYLSCYAGYGMHTANYDNGQSQYNQVFHNAMWKIFVQNKDMLSGYKKYPYIPKENLHLVVDNIVEEIINNEQKNIVWKNFYTHKKIIWAPHHTIIKNAHLELSNFLLYADFMKELSLKTAKYITWSFKPHPVLKFNLYKHPDWGKIKTDEYYNFWENGSNTQYDNGEYIELFKQSDALIHDSASFLAEYIFTRKPMLYLMNSSTINDLNTFGKICLDTSYQAFNKNEIINFIDTILNQDHIKSKEIDKFITKYFKDLSGNISSSHTINILKNGIKDN